MLLHASQIGADNNVAAPSGLDVRELLNRLLAPVDRWDRAAILIVLGFTIVRLVLAQAIGFGTDESYALSISRQLSLSYFDHPPLHLWMAHYSQQLFGHGHLVRLPFIALSAMSSWAMYGLTRKLFNPIAGLYAVLALNLSAFFLVAAGSWVLPDGPLNACLLMATWTAADLLVEIRQQRRQPNETWRWISLGVWLGLAALSKYHAIVFDIGLLGFIVSTRACHAHFRKLGPYLALLTAVIVFSPVLVWNAQNHWASIDFQGSRGVPSAGGLNWEYLILQVAGGALLLLPWIFVPLLMGVRRALVNRDDVRHSLLLWLALPMVVIFTFAPLWGSRGMPHWPMPGWLLLFPLLGSYMAHAQSAWPRKWLTASAAATFAVSLIAATDSANGWIGHEVPSLHSGDPTIESMEWSQIRTYLSQRSFMGRGHVFVVGSDWKVAGKLDQALQGDMPVHVFGAAPHGYAFLPNAGGTVGNDAVLIGKPLALAAQISELRRYFRNIDPLASVPLGRNGRTEIVLAVAYAHDLLRPYPVAGQPQ